MNLTTQQLYSEIHLALSVLRTQSPKAVAEELHRLTLAVDIAKTEMQVLLKRFNTYERFAALRAGVPLSHRSKGPAPKVYYVGPSAANWARPRTAYELRSVLGVTTTHLRNLLKGLAIRQEKFPEDSSKWFFLISGKKVSSVPPAVVMGADGKPMEIQAPAGLLEEPDLVSSPAALKIVGGTPPAATPAAAPEPNSLEDFDAPESNVGHCDKHDLDFNKIQNPLTPGILPICPACAEEGEE